MSIVYYYVLLYDNELFLLLLAMHAFPAFYFSFIDRFESRERKARDQSDQMTLGGLFRDGVGWGIVVKSYNRMSMKQVALNRYRVLFLSS